MIFKFATAVSIALLISACSANVTHEPANDYGTGIRYYRPSPYLLVYSNAKGGLMWQIHYLPDQSKLMMAKPSVIGGKEEMALYFHNGILTNSTETGDTTELAKSVAAAVQAALPLLVKAAAAVKSTVPAPYLYKIVVTGNEVSFIGGKGQVASEIKVPLKGETP